MKDLPKPTRREVRKYIRRWETSPETRKYKLQEQILDFLFKEVCSSNKCKESVRLKVSALNNFYSTRIINTHRVSDHIHSIKNLKSRLNRGDLKLVEELSNVPGTNRVFYSFASKYCNRYNPEKFPIYDSYVAKTLFEYKKKISFLLFQEEGFKKLQNLL